jgi:hypothetical protein
MRYIVRNVRVAAALLAGLALAATGARSASAVTELSGPLPYVITAPGDYKVKASQSTGGLFGIIITSSNVNLDMNGQTLTGPGSGVPSWGIFVGPLVSNVRIGSSVPTAGKIQNFFYGIFLAAVNTAMITDMKLGFNSVGVAGGDCFITVTRNLIVDNDVDGIALKGICHCVSYNNVLRNGLKSRLGEGGIILAGSSSKFVCNTSSNNYLHGFAVVGHGNTFYQNTATGNGVTYKTAGSGIWLAGNDNLLLKNRTSSNYGHGIELSAVPHLTGSVDNRIESNVAQANVQSDLFDINIPACVNDWITNLFKTDNEAGANAGPGVGCIQ